MSVLMTPNHWAVLSVAVEPYQNVINQSPPSTLAPWFEGFTLPLEF